MEASVVPLTSLMMIDTRTFAFDPFVSVTAQ